MKRKTIVMFDQKSPDHWKALESEATAQIGTSNDSGTMSLIVKMEKQGIAVPAETAQKALIDAVYFVDTIVGKA